MKTFVEFINEDTADRILFACVQIPYSDKYRELMSEDEIDTNCLATVENMDTNRSTAYQYHLKLYKNYRMYTKKLYATIDLSEKEFKKCFKQLTPQQVAALKYNI